MIQMTTVEFQVPGLVDGTTPAPRLSFDPKSPFYKKADPDGIVRFTAADMIALTGGNLGLFDPDFLLNGTFADRFFQLLEVVTAGVGPAARIDVVDAEDLSVQENWFSGAEANFYEPDTLFIPQGSSVAFSGYTATPAQPVVIRINVVAWTTIEDYARLRTVACCGGGVNPPPVTSDGPTFVYRPGGPAGDNIYNDFTALTAAVQAVAGPKWIEVDDTFVAIPLIPAGTFDLNGSIIQGRPEQQLTTLRGSVGSRLQNVGGLQQNLQLQNNDPAAALIQMNASEYFDVRDGASLASLVVSPVVEWSGAGAVVLRLQGARLVSLGLGPAFGVTTGAGGTAVLESYDGSIVDDNTLEIAAGSSITVRVRDFGSDISRTHALAVGALTFGNIIASSNGVPKYDNLMDSGLTTQRWRSTVSRISQAVALLGAGVAAFGALSVGDIAGVANAIDPAAIARLEIANPAAPELSAVSVQAIAQADVAGGLAQAYASGPGSSVTGFVRAVTAHNARIRATGYGARAGGYALASAYDSTILSSGRGSLAWGYSKPYAGAGYGATTIQATDRGSVAMGASSYRGELTASGWGGMARGVATGGAFVQNTVGRIIASGIGSFASGLAEGGDIEAVLAGAHAMGRARFQVAGHQGRIRALEQGCLAGGSALSGEILAGSVASYGQGCLAWGFATSSMTGGTIPRIAAGQLGAVAIGRVSGPNSLIQAYNVGSFAMGVAVTAANTSTAEIVTSGDQAGSFAFGVAEASGAFVGRIRSSENGSFAIGRASATAANSYLTANQEGAFAMGNCVNGAITASQDGAFAMGMVSTGSIVASGLGATARGNVSGSRNITASGSGSMASGNAQAAIGGADITASGVGSFAQGNADTGAIVASASNAVQFGPGTNSVADSVRIGSAGLHLKGTTGAFGAAANGQIWESGGNVYIRSGGATRNCTNIP